LIDTRFLPHNTHLESRSEFRYLDPQLRRLSRQPLVWRSPLLDALPEGVPGIYTLGGGRQVGKTTLLKQWVAELLERGEEPGRIAFLTGELIDDHHALVGLLGDVLGQMPRGGPRTVILDEVTYTRDWDKGVKYLADVGALDDVVLVVTGSDLVVIQDARLRLPGRRGPSEVVDFHLHPLSFGATVRLRGRIPDLDNLLDPSHEPGAVAVRSLHDELESYLRHGGFLTAINDVERHGSVQPATLRTYAEWVRGDALKRGKREHYLREVLTSVLDRMGSQVTWNALARELSIDHPSTVQDYVLLLESMDAFFVQPALVEDRLTGAPKKARKVQPADPFVAHAVRSWLHPAPDAWGVVCAEVEDPERSSRLVEAAVAAHYRRLFPTFYVKAAGEVDVAYVHRGRFWPVEVEWRGRLRPGDLKQVRKYANGVLLAPVSAAGEVEGVPVRSLALELLRLDGAGRPTA